MQKIIITGEELQTLLHTGNLPTRVTDEECDCFNCSGTNERTLNDIIRDFDARNNVKEEEFLEQDKILHEIFRQKDKPDWASSSAIPGTVEVKTVLNTRDGRKIGNAVVADIIYDVVTTEVNFLIVTDAGNVLTINPTKIQELFHEPEWVTYRYSDKSAESGLANYYKQLVC